MTLLKQKNMNVCKQEKDTLKRGSVACNGNRNSQLACQLQIESQSKWVDAHVDIDKFLSSSHFHKVSRIIVRLIYSLRNDQRGELYAEMTLK